MTVEDYEGWIPRGDLEQPDQPGDLPLKVTVKVHKKGEPAVPREAKLQIARERGLPVLLLARPELPEVERSFADPDELWQALQPLLRDSR